MNRLQKNVSFKMSLQAINTLIVTFNPTVNSPINTTLIFLKPKTATQCKDLVTLVHL